MTHAQWSLVWGNVWVMVGVAAACFVVGELIGNVSQVDKLWSIVPVGYSWIVTARSSFDSRMVLMSVAATVWGVRLTYNFSRQGGYSWRFWGGEEDYPLGPSTRVAGPSDPRRLDALRPLLHLPVPERAAAVVHPPDRRGTRFR